MAAIDRFPQVSRFEGGARLASHTISCCRCPARAEVKAQRDGSHAVATVAGRFRRLGWHVAARATGDLCPECQHGGARPIGLTRYNPENETMAHIAALPDKAEPPRPISREDRQKIATALDAYYDLEAHRYKAAWTDEKVAAQVDQPRAEVSSLRELLYGPEANEAQETRNADLKALQAQSKAASEDAFKLAERFEAIAAEAQRLLS